MRTLDVSLGSIAALVLAAACSRHADIASDPDGGFVTPPVGLSDAGVLPVDAGLDAALGAGCADRPFGVACRGANDFPCRFLGWVTDVAEACLTRTGCRTNGILAVEMGAEGCVTGLSMSEPDGAFARCAAEEFSAVRCECGAQRGEEFLGIGNDGCD